MVHTCVRANTHHIPHPDPRSLMSFTRCTVAPAPLLKGCGIPLSDVTITQFHTSISNISTAAAIIEVRTYMHVHTVYPFSLGGEGPGNLTNVLTHINHLQLHGNRDY